MSCSIYMLSDMSTPFSPKPLRFSLTLWSAWWRALAPLRPACSRTATFLWLAALLAALCILPDLVRGYQLAARLGPAPLLLLQPPALLPLRRPQPGNPHPALVPGAVAIAAAAYCPGGFPPRGPGRWPQTSQGGTPDARGQIPPSGIGLQLQSRVHHGAQPPGGGAAGARSGDHLGDAGGGPHSRGRSLV